MPRAFSFVISLALAGLLATASAPAQACKCMVPEVETAREDASALFEGRVREIAESEQDASATNGELKVKLTVVRTWKGLEHAEQVDVWTNGSSAACGYMFAKDVSYLVYAREQDGRLYVSGCSRTRPIADASEDLKLLGAGSTPVEIGTKAKGDGGAVGPDAQSSRAALSPRTSGEHKAERSGGCASGPRSSPAGGGFALAGLLAAAWRLRRRARA